jgi:hypothetical protein
MIRLGLMQIFEREHTLPTVYFEPDHGTGYNEQYVVRAAIDQAIANALTGSSGPPDTRSLTDLFDLAERIRTGVDGLNEIGWKPIIGLTRYEIGLMGAACAGFASRTQLDSVRLAQTDNSAGPRLLNGRMAEGISQVIMTQGIPFGELPQAPVKRQAGFNTTWTS